MVLADQNETIHHNNMLVTDALAEAGRKIFAVQLEKMLFHEAGSRTGEDIESVHQMRVATRRMRSLFKLVGHVYTPKTVKKYNRSLRQIARTLGSIRDLDVLIEDLEAFGNTLSKADKLVLQSVIKKLNKRRKKHRIVLNTLFDSTFYEGFVSKFGKFTQNTGKGAITIEQYETPHQVRHVLPILLHERLATVRAYDTVLMNAADETLHALRVECKQLRYAVEFFKPILGTSAGKFIKEVKSLQDVLGRFNDISVFTEYIQTIKRLSPEQKTLMQTYIDVRQEELGDLRIKFSEQWQSFNQRTVQRYFADSLLILR